ncbi:MAG: universal stress protein [Bacteroidales bacterium]|nr:universal stress protein [Bacteroidales bacterium]
MKFNNIILVPTDFSDVCHNAIDYAVQIAQQINFKVMIYHVINKDSQAALKGEKDIAVAVAEKLQNIADEFKLQNNNVEIEFLYENGSIFDLIHKKATDIGANIILLGTHGKKGMQKLFGSYALKVITQAQVPTVVVQMKEFRGVNNILFPINTFTEARQKVGYAIAVASRFGSTIHIYKEKVNDPAELSRIEIISKQITDEFNKAGISYTVQKAEKGGESAKKLIDRAVETNMDLIMIVTEPLTWGHGTKK